MNKIDNRISEFLSGDFLFKPLPVIECKICKCTAVPYMVYDFGKSCSQRNRTDKIYGLPVYYFKCVSCGFFFTPMFDNVQSSFWTANVYNKDYYEFIDAEYKFARPYESSIVVRSILNLLGVGYAKGLDYGGGNGKFSQLMNKNGHDFISYDPYDFNKKKPIEGKYNVICVFEVLEHVTDPLETFSDIVSFANPQSIIISTTQIQPDNCYIPARVHQEYIAPRNGHVSIHTKKSLGLISAKHGLNFAQIGYGLQIYSSHISTQKMYIAGLIAKLFIKILRSIGK